MLNRRGVRRATVEFAVPVLVADRRMLSAMSGSRCAPPSSSTSATQRRSRTVPAPRSIRARATRLELATLSLGSAAIAAMACGFRSTEPKRPRSDPFDPLRPGLTGAATGAHPRRLYLHLLCRADPAATRVTYSSPRPWWRTGGLVSSYPETGLTRIPGRPLRDRGTVTLPLRTDESFEGLRASQHRLRLRLMSRLAALQVGDHELRRCTDSWRRWFLILSSR